MMLYYVLFIEGDVEPRLVGPYSLEGKRDDMAKALRLGSGPAHGIFALDLKTRPGSGNLIEVRAYSGQFFEEE